MMIGMMIVMMIVMMIDTHTALKTKKKCSKDPSLASGSIAVHIGRLNCSSLLTSFGAVVPLELPPPAVVML